MRNLKSFIAALGAALLLATGTAMGVNAIPAEQIDEQQIYYGNAKAFEKAATVDYTAVVKATPEYAEIKKKKIDSSTARYWILMSSASEHAVRMISEVGDETEHDLIVSIGYLGKITPPIAAEDLTEKVLEKFEPNGKKQAKNDAPVVSQKAPAANKASDEAAAEDGKERKGSREKARDRDRSRAQARGR